MNCVYQARKGNRLIFLYLRLYDRLIRCKSLEDGDVNAVGEIIRGKRKSSLFSLTTTDTSVIIPGINLLREGNKLSWKAKRFGA